MKLYIPANLLIKATLSSCGRITFSMQGLSQDHVEYLAEKLKDYSDISVYITIEQLHRNNKPNPHRLFTANNQQGSALFKNTELSFSITLEDNQKRHSQSVQRISNPIAFKNYIDQTLQKQISIKHSNLKLSFNGFYSINPTYINPTGDIERILPRTESLSTTGQNESKEAILIQDPNDADNNFITETFLQPGLQDFKTLQLSETNTESSSISQGTQTPRW